MCYISVYYISCGFYSYNKCFDLKIGRLGATYFYMTGGYREAMIMSLALSTTEVSRAVR